MTNILDIKSLSVTYKSREGQGWPALRGIDFGVKAGEVVALVGESGSGKSTVALCIGRLIEAAQAEIKGQILFNGQNTLDMSENDIRELRRHQLGYVFQNPHLSLNPVILIQEQLDESVSTKKYNWVELLTKLQFKDPERVLKSYPHELSGGMKQRIMIAMAMAKKPKLLIADEPTTALDPTAQLEIIELIQTLKSTFDTTVLFITHDLMIAKTIADHILIMNSGSIVEVIDNQKQPQPQSDYGQKLYAASFLPKVPKTKININP
ncbi:MAG: ABC-type dipeptide/oligopeptide/nickel transport system ATPase component [Candidatus Omnitrophota bacterium]|jgi:ABC-type dipeptide/oligopeptide/nickel transport system ATPase component